MKFKPKKSGKTLSDKIADALTVKPRPDIEDDQVFGTKPKIVSHVDFDSGSEDEVAISDFHRRNVRLLSEIDKKYEGKVVSRADVDDHASDDASDDSKMQRYSSEDEDTSVQPHANGKSDATDSEGDDSSDEDTAKHAKDNEIDSDESDEGESDDYSITKFQKLDKDHEPDVGDDDDDEEEGIDISVMAEPMQEVFKQMTKPNISEEARKGNCVRNQLLLWEGLLEMRIHLQRCLNTANQMPLPATHEEFRKNKEFLEETNSTKKNVTNVLEKLLSLQSMLLKKFPETKTLSAKLKSGEDQNKTKQEDSDEEIPSDTEDEEIPSDTEEEDNVAEEGAKDTTNNIKKRKLDDYEKDISTTHKIFKSFRDTTIQKWHEKTRLTTAANIKNAPTNTILQQINYILTDKQKLVRRTQLKRSEYDIVGYTSQETKEEAKDVELNPSSRDRKDNDEYIPEIFDDNDFYHQLLRELIECKSADISDPVQLSRQWIALQQMRSKMKRKVDTKATKGRKIKYVVHNKLINYMAPEQCNTWTEESANELYSSLFGKMFEYNNVGLNAHLENGK